MFDLEQVDAFAQKLQAISEMIHDPVFESYMKMMEAGAKEPPYFDRMVTVKDAAKILGVNKSRIYSLAKEGHLKAYRLPDSLCQRFWLHDLMSLPKPTEGGGQA